ncbi:MAG: MlaE family ABC transporter permease [Desulfobacterales bacterium]
MVGNNSGEAVPPVIRPLLALGRTGAGWIDHLGAAAIFFFRSFILIFRPRYAAAIVHQVYFIGVKTFSIVSLVALFTGMVMGLQLYYTLVKFGSVGALGSAVALSLVRELGPVMTAIMIIARAGSAMTAEIGILRISEQIDALVTMRIDPLGYLVSPRIAASILSFPVLTAFFDLVGIFGGYVSGVILAAADPGSFWFRVTSSVDMKDVTGGFVKSLVFAVIVSTICCYQGFFTHLQTEAKGAKGVSQSTTSAVVLSCVFVLISDYIVTSFIL